MGRGTVFMLETWPVCLGVGTVLGFLSGLGVGGGSLLILWLTLVLGWAQNTARCLNLLFFLPAALVSCFFRWKQRTVDIRKILPAVIAGCMAVVLTNFLGRNLDSQIIQKLFGGLLLLTGLRELLYKPKSEGS